MKKQAFTVLILALALLIPGLSVAKDQKSGPWIHVEVLEDGSDGAKVKVNLPLSLAEMALGMIEDGDIHGGKIRFDDTDLSVSDLRAMWKELKNAGDAEFVTVEEKDETVRVFRKGNRVFVNVDGRKGEKVRIELPVALVDALLSGDDDDELDMAAAMTELQKMGSGEIVRVEDGKDTVRIWID
jgi:hypothetical protein